jgi:hypothetical protein
MILVLAMWRTEALLKYEGRKESVGGMYYMVLAYLQYGAETHW